MLGRHVSVAKFVLEVAGNLENDTFLLGMMKVSMFFLEYCYLSTSCKTDLCCAIAHFQPRLHANLTHLLFNVLQPSNQKTAATEVVNVMLVS